MSVKETKSVCTVTLPGRIELLGCCVEVVPERLSDRLFLAGGADWVNFYRADVEICDVSVPSSTFERGLLKGMPSNALLVD